NTHCCAQRQANDTVIRFPPNGNVNRCTNPECAAAIIVNADYSRDREGLPVTSIDFDGSLSRGCINAFLNAFSMLAVTVNSYSLCLLELAAVDSLNAPCSTDADCPWTGVCLTSLG